MDIAEQMNERMKDLFPGVLGMRIREATPERVRAELTVRPELCTGGDVMHGGAIMAFADTLGAVATVVHLPPGAGTTTLESKTNFMRAARTGQTVTGETVALHRGRTTMVWQTRITGEDDKLVAIVTQTQMVLAPRSGA